MHYVLKYTRPAQDIVIHKPINPDNLKTKVNLLKWALLIEHKDETEIALRSFIVQKR